MRIFPRYAFALVAVIVSLLRVQSNAAVEVATETFVANAFDIVGPQVEEEVVWNAIAPLHVNQVLAAVTVASVDGESLVVRAAAWVAGDFLPAGSHYIESDNGYVIDIVQAEELQLETSEALAGKILVGDSIRVRKHLTIADFFGANNEAGLQGGRNLREADNILIQDPGSGEINLIFYSTITGLEGWRSVAFEDASGEIVRTGQGIVLGRKGQGDFSFVSVGAVKQGGTRVTIKPGFNLVATMRPELDLELASLGLTELGDAGFRSGPNLRVADAIFTVAPRSASDVFFSSSLAGLEGWRDVGFNDASQVGVPASSAFYIRRTEGPEFEWLIPGSDGN